MVPASTVIGGLSLPSRRVLSSSVWQVSADTAATDSRFSSTTSTTPSTAIALGGEKDGATPGASFFSSIATSSSTCPRSAGGWSKPLLKLSRGFFTIPDMVATLSLAASPATAFPAPKSAAGSPMLPKKIPRLSPTAEEHAAIKPPVPRHAYPANAADSLLRRQALPPKHSPNPLSLSSSTPTHCRNTGTTLAQLKVYPKHKRSYVYCAMMCIQTTENHAHSTCAHTHTLYSIPYDAYPQSITYEEQTNTHDQTSVASIL